MWRALAFGAPDVPVRIGMWILKLADRLILQMYVPLSLVGVYSLGYMIGSTAFELVGSSVNAAILPFFYLTASQESKQSSRRVFASLAAYEAAALAFLGLATILFAHEFILVAATSKYLGAEPLVPIIVWGTLFLNLSHVPMRAIYNEKKTLWLPVVFLVPAALNVLLNFLWIPRYGLFGAAWATFVAYPVLLVLHFVVAQRVYPIPYNYGRMATPLVLMLVLSVAKGAVPVEPSLLALASKALLLAVFPALLWVSGFFTAEERSALVQFVLRTLPLRGRADETRRTLSARASADGSIQRARRSDAPEKGDDPLPARSHSDHPRIRAARPPAGETP